MSKPSDAFPKCDPTLCFRRDSWGRLLARNDIWSSRAPACVDCGTTKKKHEALGRCQNCYVKFRYQTDPEFAAKVRARSKQSALRSDRPEIYEAKRRDDPHRRAQHKIISRRWAQKHCRWPIGAVVEYELAPGCPWIKGAIVSKSNTAAVVQFATFQEKIAFRKLRLVARSEAA